MHCLLFYFTRLLGPVHCMSPVAEILGGLETPGPHEVGAYNR